MFSNNSVMFTRKNTHAKTRVLGRASALLQPAPHTGVDKV